MTGERVGSGWEYQEEIVTVSAVAAVVCVAAETARREPTVPEDETMAPNPIASHLGEDKITDQVKAHKKSAETTTQHRSSRRNTVG